MYSAHSLCSVNVLLLLDVVITFVYTMFVLLCNITHVNFLIDHYEYIENCFIQNIGKYKDVGIIGGYN